MDIKPIITYDFYNRHFNHNHNLSCGHPRSDNCQKCDRLENTIAAEENTESKTRLESEKRLHLQKAAIFYIKLREYTNIALLFFKYRIALSISWIEELDVTIGSSLGGVPTGLSPLA